MDAVFVLTAVQSRYGLLLFGFPEGWKTMQSIACTSALLQAVHLKMSDLVDSQDVAGVEWSSPCAMLTLYTYTLLYDALPSAFYLMPCALCIMPYTYILLTVAYLINVPYLP